MPLDAGSTPAVSIFNLNWFRSLGVNAGRQVENARCGIQENGGGLIGTESAIVAITILGK